jgi:carboxyl-terminal processing protease
VSFRQSFLFTLLVGLVITAAFLTGYWTCDRMDSPNQFSILQEAHSLLTTYGLATPPAGRALEYGMIRGMLQAYGDPFTSFSEPALAELQSNQLQGNFGGIGANLGRDAEGFHILFPFPDGPAARAGITDGDRILFVDDIQIVPETAVEEIQAAIRGTVGTEVILTLARAPAYLPIKIPVVRAEYATPSVIRYQEPRQPLLGVIKVNMITATTPDEIQAAADELFDRGVTHLALDLRDNFGGFLIEGVEISRLFLQKGVIIVEEHKDQAVINHEVNEPGPLSDIPMVVLINQNTASAAEIIAGAIQANGRAPLIGTPSYGKDKLQVVFQLQDQSRLVITSGRWWIPGKELPRDQQGLQPDFLVDPAIGDPDPSLEKAIEIFFQAP